MQLSLAFLIVAVFKRNSVEFPRFLPLNFTVKKSDFEWFASTDRNYFLVQLQTLHEIYIGKTILEHFTGELDAAFIK